LIDFKDRTMFSHINGNVGKPRLMGLNNRFTVKKRKKTVLGMKVKREKRNFVIFKDNPLTNFINGKLSPRHFY